MIITSYIQVQNCIAVLFFSVKINCNTIRSYYNKTYTIYEFSTVNEMTNVRVFNKFFYYFRRFQTAIIKQLKKGQNDFKMLILVLINFYILNVATRD